jgi:hypothetical protein
MIVKFGIWEIRDIGIIGVRENGGEYVIERSRLCEIRNYEGHETWDWLIHLTDKHG